MKKIYLLLLALTYTCISDAQTFGVYTPTVIGTTAHNVKVVTKAVFATVGARIGHSYIVDHSNKTIRLRSCYIPGGVLQAHSTFVDTVNIGFLHQGNFTLDYAAYYTSSYSECIPYDTIVKPPFQFYVGPNSLTEFDLENNIQIFPNPAKNNLTIKCGYDNLKIDKLSIYNSIGQIVMGSTSPKLNEEINIEELQSGIYFLELVSDGKYKRIKFLKE